MKTENPTISGNNGFSLIEVLIAMVILTISIFGLYSLQITNLQRNNKGNAITSTSTWGTDQVEYLLALDYGHPDLDNGSHGPFDRDRYNISWEVSENSPLDGNKSITISVTSNIHGGNHNYHVSCIKGQNI
ncbi:MAG: prepilin-type N-terminal cleavage/methylation domain-containing protein [Geopsychrobacter sp.]|nr:prepilin-type N-terminal cleavage/methylation domain-containing protein [Geopsychrobacter sp.]